MASASIPESACLSLFFSEHPEFAPIGSQVPTVDARECSWLDFVDRYLSQNHPVIVRHVNQGWGAEKWVTTNDHSNVTCSNDCDCTCKQSLLTSSLSSTPPTEDNPLSLLKQVHHLVTKTTPNLQYLSQQYGSSQVSIVRCSEPEFNSQKRSEQPLSDYITRWQTHLDQHSCRCPKCTPRAIQPDNGELQGQSAPNDSCVSTGENNELFDEYCRDWHFTRDHPDEDAYRVPVCVSDDWLNEYWFYKSTTNVDITTTTCTHVDTHATISDNVLEEVTALNGPDAIQPSSPKCNNDDYRFVYLGPHSSWTPLHRDVYGSFSWSANMAGAKLWVFFPPSLAPLLAEEGSPCCDAYDVFNQQGLLEGGFNELIVKWNEWCLEDREAFRRYVASTATPSRTNDGEAHSSCSPFSSSSSTSPSPRVKVLLQEAGDLVFVPSLWSHQVHNLSDCLSINHNWLNSHASMYCDQQLSLDLQAVKEALGGWDTPMSKQDTCSQLSELTISNKFTITENWLDTFANEQQVLLSNAGTDWFDTHHLYTYSFATTLVRLMALVDIGLNHPSLSPNSHVHTQTHATDVSTVRTRLVSFVGKLPQSLRRLVRDITVNPDRSVCVDGWSTRPDNIPSRCGFLSSTDIHTNHTNTSNRARDTFGIDAVMDQPLPHNPRHSYCYYFSSNVTKQPVEYLVILTHSLLSLYKSFTFLYSEVDFTRLLTILIECEPNGVTHEASSQVRQYVLNLMNSDEQHDRYELIIDAIQRSVLKHLHSMIPLVIMNTVLLDLLDIVKPLHEFMEASTLDISRGVVDELTSLLANKHI